MILTSLCGAIGLLFRGLLEAKNAAIAREQELTNKLLPAVENNTRTLERLVEVIQGEQNRSNPRRNG